MTSTTQPSTSTLLVLSGADVRRLDLDSVLSSQRAAFLGLASGEALLGPRVLLPGEDGSVVFSYAARTRIDSPPVTKFGAVVPANADRGLAVVSAVVVALDAATGRPAALADGEAVTEVRTVATSMLAVQTLAVAPRRVAVLGSGTQGRLHARAIRELHPDVEVRVCSPFDPGLETFVAELATARPGLVAAAPTIREAVHDADVVLACTTVREPILRWQWLAPGATVVSIGGFAPDRSEVDVDTVANARVVVDDVETAWAQAGAIVAASTAGRLSLSDLTGLGDVLASGRSPRQHRDEVVLFNSVGLGIQDAALVDLLLRECEENGWGTDVAL